MSETPQELVARLMQHVEDTMVEATVDYPAGHEAGPRITYDSDFLQKCFETELTAALAREAGLREALRHIAKHWPDSFAARHARAAMAVKP